MLEAVYVFWVWWRDQLLDLVPGNAARRAVREDDALILSDPTDGAIVVRERQHGLTGIAETLRLTPGATDQLRQTAARRRLPIVLRLPDAMLLERDISLPLTAERELERVLFHEMDRFTPFTAAEVFWGWRLSGRDRVNARLALRLSLVPRQPLEPLLAGLRDAGITPSDIELAAADGSRRRITLDHDAARMAGDRMLPLALAGLAVLLVFTIALPFIMQGRAMDAVERRIAALAPTVARVQQLKHDAASSTTGADVIAAERQRAGDALSALALLTSALPDNTYLTSVTFDAGKLTLDGQSQSAAALIAPLTANRQVQDASFTAPVVRNTLGADTFSMRLRVTP